MVRRLSVVPYGRMQFVEVTAGPVERIFHLSTVKLHTAAAASDARIPGLEVGRGRPPARPAHRAGRGHGGGHVSDLPASEGWRRLHPASPVGAHRPPRARPLPALGHFERPFGRGEPDGETDYLIVFAAVTVVYGYIHWMVTRWRFEGDTLRIETGLIRKDSKRLPLARIQAVDIVRPLLGRMLGVSELRIRLAGSGATDGKLAYLGAAEAAELRIALLAGHRDPTAPARSDTGLPMAIGDRWAGCSDRCSSPWSPSILLGTIAALVILDQFEPKTAARAGGGPCRLPVGLRRHHLAAALGSVQLHRSRGARRGAHPAGPAADDLRDHPLHPDSGRASGRAVAVAPVRLVPPRGRHRRFHRAQPAQRGHGRGPQGPVAGGIPAGHLAPDRPAARRSRPGPHSAAPTSPAQGSPQLPLPLGRPRRHPRGLCHGTHQPGHHLGPSGEVAEHPAGPGSAAAPARPGHRPRRRGGAAHPGRVPRPHHGGGGSPRRGTHLPQPRGAPPRPPRALPGVHPRTRVPSGWYPDPSGRHEQRYWHDGRWTAHVGDGGRRTTEVPTTAP